MELKPMPAGPLSNGEYLVKRAALGNYAPPKRESLRSLAKAFLLGSAGLYGERIQERLCKALFINRRRRKRRWKDLRLLNM